MASSKSELRTILNGLEEQGCRVVRKTNGWQVLCPSGDIVTLHNTPSDYRALRNARSLIKRAGLRWPLDK